MTLILFSCGKADDDITYEQLRYYGPQYATEKAMIENYLKSHYIEQLVSNPGQPDDQDIKISPIPQGDTSKVALWDSPMLHYKDVDFNLLTYRVYYLTLREGVGESPSRVDEVLTAYTGYYLSTDGSATIDTRFEYTPTPNAYFGLTATIKGWQEIMTLFKKGTATPGEGPNPVVYNDFGAGVMFVPSALAYYNTAKATSDTSITIPSYSPLMFSFKMYDMRRLDQDNDGVLSIYEDRNGNGIFTDDDTDGDGTADYLDVDDDGDGFLTRFEIKHTVNDPINNILYNFYYPYNGAATDDPATLFDDTQGIPRKFTGETVEILPATVPKQYWTKPAADGSDFNDPTRLRRHLDPSATPPYYHD